MRAALVLVAVSLVVLAPLMRAPGAAAAHESKALSGWLNVLWHDRPDGKGASQPVYVLTTASGGVTYLALSGQDQGRLLSMDRQYITVYGRQAADAGSAGRSVWQVDAIHTALALDAAVPQAVTGAKPWLSILCKFSDVSAEPKSLAYFQTMLDGAYPHLNQFWTDQSYGVASISGSTAVGWYTLPQPRSSYISGGVLNHDLAARDCTAAADPYVDFRSYVGVNLMFNGELDGSAWGGTWWLTLDGQTRLWYVTWEPPWGYTDIAVLAHEMGHGFGLPHSSGPYGSVYDNVWDIMSDVWAYCSLLSDPTYGCIGQGTIAYHRDRLGWIPEAQRFTLAAGSSATITIERLSQPATGSYRIVRIPIAGSSTLFYTVEARRRIGYDVRLPDDGIVIHLVDLTRVDPAHVVDGDGNGNVADGGSVWKPGETFIDSARAVSVSVLSATASGFVVQVGEGSGAPATATPTPTPSRTATLTSTHTTTGTATATRTATPTLQTGVYLTRVNAGGTAYTDSGAALWQADQAFSAGSWGYAGGSTYATTADIAGTDDDPLYQSERYWATGATPGYRFTVPNGQYVVTFKFAEVYRSSAGKRVFDVRIEGATVLDNFDIFAVAGGKNIAAPDQVLPVTVNDGELDIDFILISGYDTPKISAIQVQSVGPAATATATATRTSTRTQTASHSPTLTATATTAPHTPTSTPTPTNTVTPLPATATPTATATVTTGPATATPTVTATAFAPAYLMRVNAGGAAYTDTSGELWRADKAFSAGSWGYAGGSTYVTTAAIAGTNDDPLYQSERYWAAGAAPGYRFTVPNGQYIVTLKFAEVYRASASKRVFDVRIEGDTVLDNLDIFAVAGGKNIAAPDQVLPVTVSDGMLDIDFIAIAGYDTPKISAIQVQSAGPAATATSTATSTAAPPSPTRTATATVTQTATSTATSGPATATPTVTATVPAPAYLMRVNAGGAAYTDTSGDLWRADKAFATGSWGYVGGSTYLTTAAIAATDDDVLYQSERYWAAGAAPGYRFTVPNGQYIVTLKLAEVYRASAGKRVFDVRIEGALVLDNLDIFAVAGGKNIAAPDQVVPVTVGDGELDIDFILISGYDTPKISAIQVSSRSATAP